MTALLKRETFSTSRLLEFCSKKELIAQTGHSPEQWPLVILKEELDNSVDACEEGDIAPQIDIDVSLDQRGAAIEISDNGPGIAPETIAGILDYTVRVSSREAYASPTRGAQGNALKTLIAMPFALDGDRGWTKIESRGVYHTIWFRVDRLRQKPVIEPVTGSSLMEKGTRITVGWPRSACSILADAEARFLQIAEDFAWLNPHLRITVRWNGVVRVEQTPSNTAWEKWRACDPTSAHWYDRERFERSVAAHVSRDQDIGRDRLVREFVSEFRGFSGSRAQKCVLDETGLARSPLSSLFGPDGSPKKDQLESLLGALKRNSKPVQPALLGLIGEPHLRAKFIANGVAETTFRYKKVLDVTDGDGLPFAIESAFGWCPGQAGRRIIVGVNWSTAIGNPFRSFSRYGGAGLEELLKDRYATANEPVIFLLHYVCPRVEYTDRGKSALLLGSGR
jgi:DNA topoisomerase VI subunit B